ncbi:MAG: DUF6169 family protein [Ferruginibacter sp.]
MQPYNYITLKPDYYTFLASNGFEYHCYFYDFSFPFSDYPRIASKVFGFNLELKSKPEISHSKGLDKRIAQTVVTILKEFLNIRKNAVVYICDNSDKREKARFHKFTNWFMKYDDGSFIQLKGILHTGNTYVLNAMLIHRDNEFLNDFIEAYQVLTGAYTKPGDDEMENILNDDGW